MAETWNDEIESPETEDVEGHSKPLKPPVAPGPFKNEKNDDDDGDDVEAHGSGKAQPPVPPTPF